MKRGTDARCPNHPDRPVHSRGLCAACYREERKAETEELDLERTPGAHVHHVPLGISKRGPMANIPVEPMPQACKWCGGRTWKMEGPLAVCATCSHGVRVR